MLGMVTSFTDLLFSIIVSTPEMSFHATRLGLSHTKHLLMSTVGFCHTCSSLVLLYMEEKVISLVFEGGQIWNPKYPWLEIT
jgi:hypothetical protein